MKFIKLFNILVLLFIMAFGLNFTTLNQATAAPDFTEYIQLQVGEIVINELDDTSYKVVNFMENGGFGNIYRITSLEEDGKDHIFKIMQNQVAYSNSLYGEIRGLDELYGLDVNEVLFRERDVQPFYLPGESKPAYYGSFSPLMDGTLSDIQGHISLTIHAENINERLRFINKFTDNLFEALKVFSSASLVHNDIKLNNIFFKKSDGFNWLDINLDKFSMQLADFNTVAINMGDIKGHTENNISPEQYKFLPHWHDGHVTFFDDIYSSGVALFDLIFNHHPMQMYVDSDPQFISSDITLRSKNRYDEYIEWIDGQFEKKLKSLSKILDDKGIAEVQRLRELVVGAMQWEPKDRVKLINKVIGKKLLIDSDGRVQKVSSFDKKKINNCSSMFMKLL